MSSRRALVAVAAAAVLALTACGPEEDKAVTAAPAPTSAAPSAAAPSAAAPSGAKSSAPAAGKSASAGASDPACNAPKLPANHKVVRPASQPKQDTLTYQETKWVCTVNDGLYEPVGEKKTLMFARTVKAQLQPGSGQYKTVVVGELWNHIGACLDKTPDAGTCSSGLSYEVTLDGEGKISEIKELYMS